ncbi:MAG: metallophosphoesterase [bacterium]|nr:metallophosphoesterase [bacterium]
MGISAFDAISRRTFLGGAFALASAPAFGAGAERLARIGVMTDTHVQKTMESCAKVRAALELFKAQGCEMVVNCGDIADQHFPDGYRCYRRTVKEVYPEPASRPKDVFVYAFHDVCNYKPGTWWGDIAANAAAAFEDVRVALEAPNGHTHAFTWKGMPFLVFPQSTGMKGFLSWEDYEKAVAKACAANPGKPVFVLDHLPPAGTTFHSHHWGSAPCRRILNKFPQVVHLSGHVHGSLASERQIWQGEFTAVNAGCLNTWGGFAPGSTPPRQAKENFGVLVMDVYADRLVFFRYDVRDRSEAGKPWIVPLPFAAKAAPYRPEVAQTRLPRASFAAGAAVSIVREGAGYRVSFPEARTGAEAFMYRLACQRRTAAGEWKTFTRDDIFADFWKAPKDRTGTMSYVLDAAFFKTGETYRLTVTPLDWFYRETPGVSVEFTADVGAGASIWSCADPKADLKFTEYGRPVPISPEGFFAPPSGQGTLRLPEHAFKVLNPGQKGRLVLDLDLRIPEEDWHAWRVSFRARGGGGSLAEIQTPPGAPGVLRYVMPFTVPAGGLDTCDVLFNYVTPGASVRVDALACFIVE